MEFAKLAYQTNAQYRQTEMIIYGVLGLLFQPFFKIALGRKIWNVVDVVVGIVFALIDQIKLLFKLIPNSTVKSKVYKTTTRR